MTSRTAVLEEAGPGGDIEAIGKAGLAAGTVLLIPDGSKPIEDFRAGDLVLSRHEGNPEGSVEAQQVLTVSQTDSPLFDLHVGGQVIRTAAEHPFWVAGRGWIAAHQLMPGDFLLGAEGEQTAVTRVDGPKGSAPVYNLEVDEYHTYWVGSVAGSFSVWAHNACHVNANPASSQQGEQFRARAQELWDTLPEPNRYGATVAVTEVNGREVVSLFANVGPGRKQFSQAQINQFIKSVEDAGGMVIHTSGDVHAEPALHQLHPTAPAIGISNPYGPCPACGRYFQQQGYLNLFWPDRP